MQKLEVEDQLELMQLRYSNGMLRASLFIASLTISVLLGYILYVWGQHANC